MFKFLTMTLFLGIVSTAAHANCLDSEGILRIGAASLVPAKCTGKIALMSQCKALKACPAGTRLPTIRELAERSQDLGARGILEKDEVTGVFAPQGYHFVNAINSDGTKDEFYFDNDGYQGNRGFLEQRWFWSSSVQSVNPYSGYYFNAFNGFFYDHSRQDDNAVLCVAGDSSLPSGPLFTDSWCD